MSRLNNSKNIFWINAVKALCILAVYFVHCEIYYGVSFQTLNDIIHPVYVNGFFFVSGYLLFRKQLSSPLIDQPFSSFITTSGGEILFIDWLFRPYYLLWLSISPRR